MIPVLLILLGVFLRWAAILELKDCFSMDEKQKPKVFVRRGIYKVMRHPSYAGSLLIILGTTMLSNIAGVMLIAWAFFRARIASEEATLDTVDGYKQYKKQVGMFSPRVKKWRQY